MIHCPALSINAGKGKHRSSYQIDGCSYGTFTVADRGLKYFKAEHYPNLVAIKLAFPFVSWTDLTSLGGSLPLERYNFSGWKSLRNLPELKVLVIERFQFDNDEERSGYVTLQCYRRI